MLSAVRVSFWIKSIRGVRHEDNWKCAGCVWYCLRLYFAYRFLKNEQLQKQLLTEEMERIEGDQDMGQSTPDLFKVEHGDAFATLEIPKPERAFQIN